jgi:hypothetical protein
VYESYKTIPRELGIVRSDNTFEFTNNYVINSTWVNYLKTNSAELVHDSNNLWITLMNKETKDKSRFFAVNCPEEWKM